MAKRKRSPRRKSTIKAPSPRGNTIHPVLASPKVNSGDTIKIKVFALLGKIDSLIKSFSPSASA